MPAGSTYTPIANTTLGSAQASVTFSSLGSYTDIVLVNQASPTSGAVSWNLTFNGDTGSNYSYTYLDGNGSAAGSGRTSNATKIVPNNNGYMVAGEIAMVIINIQNYSNTSTFKTVLSRAGNASNGTSAVVGLWRNTAAITSITLSASSSTFIAGSTFTIYGIASA
jgi:hypothetical protein